MAQITSTLSVVSCNAQICRHDNQTNICANGYKLNYLGRCLSQSLGKWNSTGFEPSYPVCLIEYESLLDSVGKIKAISNTVVGSGVQLKDSVYGVLEGDSSPVVKVSTTLASTTTEVQTDITTTGDGNIFSNAIHKTSSVGHVIVENEATADFNVHHAGKNIISHVAGASSEYWVVDTYTDVPIIKRENNISKFYGINGLSKPQGFSYIICSDTASSGVGTPYKAICGSLDLPLGLTLASGEEGDNPAYICADDTVAPVVTAVSPLAWSHLNSPSSNIDLYVSDAVGGVDIGLLSVTVVGNITSQPEGTLVVSSGIDMTGGRVSVSGDANRVGILYSPTNDWALGEHVVVTVSGQDLVPLSGGEPWSCFEPDVRNVFGQYYDFYVYDTADLGVSITAIPDTAAPYLTNVSPGMYTRENSATSVVSFDIVDDVTGVDLTSLDISVNGVNVVLSGVAQTSEVTLYALYNGYRFYYDSTSGYSYGSNVNISVSVSDEYELSPNSVLVSYFFTVVDETTLVVDDFSPAANTSYLAATKNISVDVYDSSFGLEDTYFVINGVVVSGTRTDILGQSNLSTTVSGVTTLSGASYSTALITGACITGLTISGTSLYGGTIVSGSVTSGTATILPVPFDEMPTMTVVAGTIETGSFISGISLDTLVSGVNWDGNYTPGYVYGITVSGSEMSGVVASGVTVSGVIGYTLNYHPPNDFNYQDVVNVVVHGSNKNSLARVVKNEPYQLYYGYRVLANKQEFRHDQSVSVSARAVNTTMVKNALSDIYTFSVYKQPSVDVSASIFPKVVIDDMAAQIGVIAPTHSYGQTMSIEIYVEDKEGNALGPYTFEYTIETG